MIPPLIYKEMAPQLADGATAGYRAGLAAMAKLNKKKILQLTENPLNKEEKNFAELFKVAYTGADKRLLQNFEVEAFVVAGVLQYEAEEKLKAMAKSLLDGTHPLLQKHPEMDIAKLWRDEAYSILGQYMDVPDAPAPGILQTNLRTATNSAYHAAQWQRLQDVQDVYPAYQYMTRDDDRVREEHRALHEKVFLANDPIWNIIYPPNGWNCRCYIIPLTNDELASISPQLRVPLTDMKQHDALIEQANIEKNFRRNSGQSASIWGKWLESEMRNINFAQVTKRLRADAEERNLTEEIWGEFVRSGQTVKITIKKSGEKILVKIGDKEIEDDVENIDKYRRGVLLE